MKKGKYHDKGQTFKQSSILRILTGEEALVLRARPGVSIGVVVILTKFEDKKVKAITITENNKRDSYTKTKFPSGGLEYGEHPYAGAIREARSETGYEICTEDMEFCWGAEYSTTIAGETHYKLFIIAKKQKRVGEPIFDGEDEILSVDWRNFDDIEQRIVKGQRVAFQPIIDKMLTFNSDYGFALMNKHAVESPEEGIYDVK